MATKARIDLIGRDKTKAAFRSAESSLKRFRSTALSIGTVLGVGVFKAATTGAINFADSIDKAAKAAGVGSDFLQEMRFAGDQLGVTNKLVDEGFRRFSRRLGEFANSGAGPAAKAIQKLGIEVNDAQGKFRGSEAIFRDFAVQLQQFDSFAEKSAIAAQIFGDDAGPKLALLLEQGISGIDRLSREARDIGAVLSEEVIANAVEAKDASAKLAAVLKAQLTLAFVNLGPAITTAANALVAFSKLIKDALGNTQYDGLAFLDDQIDTTVKKIAKLNESIAGGGLSDINTDRAIIQLKALGQQYARLKETRDNLSKGDTKIDTAVPAIASPVGLEKSQDAFTKWKTTIIDVGAETQDLQRKVKFLDEAMLSGAISTESHRIALERLTGKQSQQAGEVEKALDRTGEKAAEVSKGAVDMGFAFESAFEDAVLGGEEFSDVLDGLLKDLQKVALRQLITAPAGNALSAGISRTFPGFATGGSFRVGGSGGTDSQLVAFKASPGEHVAVSRGGQEDGGTTVNVINNSGATAEVKRSNDGGGRELINVIIGQVASNISSGGQVAQAMQGAFGMRRQGIVRT